MTERVRLRPIGERPFRPSSGSTWRRKATGEVFTVWRAEGWAILCVHCRDVNGRLATLWPDGDWRDEYEEITEGGVERA